MTRISLNDVSKSFPRHAGQVLLRTRLKTLFSRSQDPFYARRHISFELADGESLGVIGSNGAGKSTLLGLIAGTIYPSSGNVTVNGKVSALLELGSGFHPDLSGRENVKINAALLGFTEKEVKVKFEEILEFSGIGEF